MNASELVYINTGLLKVTVKGKAAHPDFNDIEIHDYESCLKITCADGFSAELKDAPIAVSSAERAGYHSQNYAVSPMFYEQQNYEIIIESEPGSNAEFWHDNINIRNKISSVGRNSGILSGIINFGSEIGSSDLVVKVNGEEYLTVTIEIFPTKISYKEDYKAIVADVTAEVYNLVFDFLKKTYSNFGIAENVNASPVEFFAIINEVYARFINSADMILSQPHHILETTREILPAFKAKKTDDQSLRWLEKHPENALIKEGRVLADKVLAVKKQVTYNTKENQLTKFILQSTAKKLAQFKSRYLKLDRPEDIELTKKIEGMISGIMRRSNSGFLSEVDAKSLSSGMSLVFSMAPGYRDLYKYYLMLQHGLSITGDVFNISLKDLAQLYEYWCFIKLNNIMRENRDKYKLVSQDIIKIQGNGIFVSLVKGKGSRVKYVNLKTNELITLSYNPSEINVPTVNQKPDNVLKLQKNGAKTDYEYVFDAKYRIDPALDDTPYKKNYKTPGPKESDINTMHRYRDAIVYSNDASPFERTMFGAYILFPYGNEVEYRNHHFYKSIGKVNIGGLPFLPSATELVRDMLEELISDSPASAFERATLPKGIEEKLAKVDWTKRDVLIGTFRSQNQFNICKEKKFYYIPAKRIKDENLPIHYVAAFQTPRVFTDKAGIYYYGEVLRTALVRRSAIKDVPITQNNPDELYYRFALREWIPLRKPILPKEQGFVYEYTNMFLLENSEFVPELKLDSEEEYRLYTELKHRVNDVRIEGEETSSGFTVNNAAIRFDNGMIIVNKNGIDFTRYAIQAFLKTPNAVFRRIQKDII